MRRAREQRKNNARAPVTPLSLASRTCVNAPVERESRPVEKKKQRRAADCYGAAVSSYYANDRAGIREQARRSLREVLNCDATRTQRAGFAQVRPTMQSRNGTRNLAS